MTRFLKTQVLQMSVNLSFLPYKQLKNNGEVLGVLTDLQREVQKHAPVLLTRQKTIPALQYTR